MRILFLTQYFKPEIGPVQDRIFSQAKYLVEKGHEITILTCFPNYPRGKVYPGWKQKLLKRENLEGIKIIRVFSFISDKKGLFFRLLSCFTFSLFSLLGCFLVGKQNIVIVESPPFILGYAGYLISKLKKSVFIYHISDLWIDAAIALKIVSPNSLLVKASLFLDIFICQRANLIITVTAGCEKHLIDKGIQPDKIKILTNGIDVEIFRPMKNVKQLKENFNFNKKFIVIYAGTMGYMHAAKTLVYAADKLRDYYNIFFLFIGNGVAKKEMESIASNLKLKNILFLNSMEPERLSQYINASDIGVATLKWGPFSKSALSVKALSYMACGIPIVSACEGITADIIKKARAGICVEPENPKQLSEALLTLYNNKNLCHEYGDNARAFVIKNYSRKVLSAKLETLLLNTIAKK